MLDKGHPVSATSWITIFYGDVRVKSAARAVHVVLGCLCDREDGADDVVTFDSAGLEFFQNSCMKDVSIYGSVRVAHLRRK